MKVSTGILALLLTTIVVRVIAHRLFPGRPFVPEWVYMKEVEVKPSRKAYPSARRVPLSLKELRYRVS